MSHTNASSLFSARIPAWQRAVWEGCRHPTGTCHEFGRIPVERSLVQRFESMVQRYPDRLAIRFHGESMTYGQLNRRANQVARAIVQHAGPGPAPVAILMRPGIRPVVAMLGALKAGKFYVPMEPTSADHSIKRMLDQAGIALLVTGAEGIDRAWRLAPGAALDLDDLPAGLATDDVHLPIPPDAIACITYTSGSTGEPKGAFLMHSSVLANIRNYTNLVRICPDDRLSMVRSHAFNGAIKDIYGALLNGASLHPFDLAQQGTAALAGWLRTEAISVYCSVTTTWRQLTSSLTGDQRLPDLRLLFIGGEPAYAKDLQRWWATGASTCLVLFGYGISEAGHVTGLLFEPGQPLADGPLPSGFAADDVCVHILDDAGCLLPPGAVGQIAVSSPALAAGYWRRPGLTATMFRPGPDGQRLYCAGDLGRLDAEGCLHHLGRVDQQAKVAGQRIELGDVEAALLSLPAVREAAVTLYRRPDGESRLAAYIVAVGADPPSISQLRAALRIQLPAAMLPSIFVTLPALPKTAMGKIDRRNLPAPTFVRPTLDTAYEAPRSPLEEQLIAIWEEVLGIQGIGAHDAFFDLGGSSLLAMQILQRVNQRLRVDLTPAQLFDLSTVEKMAAAVMEQWLAEPDGQRSTARWLDEQLASL